MIILFKEDLFFYERMFEFPIGYCRRGYLGLVADTLHYNFTNWQDVSCC